MNSTTHGTQTAHHVLAGVAIGSGTMVEWITLNSSFITVSAVALTTVASIVFGIVNARTQRMRNRINKRSIVEDLIDSLDENKTYSFEEIKKELRK